MITVLVIVAGAVRVLSAELSVADMLTFLLCVAVLVDPVSRLANLARLWQEGHTGFVRAMELLDTAPDIEDRDGTVELTELVQRVAGVIYEGGDVRLLHLRRAVLVQRRLIVTALVGGVALLV